LIGYAGNPPNCHPECVTSADCPQNKACSNQKCYDPCRDYCGSQAQCRVISHVAMCYCPPGMIGNPLRACIRQQEPITALVIPCDPNPCGLNAICRSRDNRNSYCECLPNFFGNPYQGCHPECTTDRDCPLNKACLQEKCNSPCPGVCGPNANCFVQNHKPICNCLPGYTGNPYRGCSIQRLQEPFERPLVPLITSIPNQKRKPVKIFFELKA